jgi:ATP/maltotriose-dependent transcriptional regulator MalT
VRAAVRPAADPIDIIDALIGYLARNRILLVLDDYHRLEKSALAELADRLERSRTPCGPRQATAFRRR